MGQAAKRLPVTFDSLVAAAIGEQSVPSNAWTLQDFMDKTGVSQSWAHRQHQRLVRSGQLVQGGPKRKFYWPA